MPDNMSQAEFALYIAVLSRAGTPSNSSFYVTSDADTYLEWLKSHDGER